MHSSRMHTDCQLTVSQTPPPPPQADPLHADPSLHADALPPKGRPSPPKGRPTPSKGRPTPSKGRPPCGQTNMCKNITFPHTSYAVGKNLRNSTRIGFIVDAQLFLKPFDQV